MIKFELDEYTTLRLPDPRDAEQLFAAVDRNRRYLREWLPWVDGTKSADDTRAFIERSKEQHASGKGFQTVIWHRGEVVGCAGYHAIDQANALVGIGYWLAEEAQGQGIMTKTVRRLTAYAFEEFGLNRVEICCGSENAKSRAIPERLGFTLEGRIRDAERVSGRFIDHVVYGMLKREWKGERDDG